jgi:peptidoglycan hydrolase-like protein with peptidoglycan-binding domain
MPRVSLGRGLQESVRGWLVVGSSLIVRAVVGRFVIAIIACLVVVACWCLAPATAAADPFSGRGMWIWYVSRSAGGDPSAIAAQARLNGIKTLFIKSGDGGGYWSQFSGSLVRSLHAGRMNVCAWQYVYGTDPLAEAAVGARAVRNGADCLVIDAEAEYEGRYASAQTYIDALRAAVGPRYPVGLASFPYVDYHPGFPYSVFLGHRGAQFNLPQMYWREIGTNVDGVYRHTYADNRIYRRPIRPLGQTDNGASASEIALFRGLSVSYGARGLSWWDFAWATADAQWPALSGPYTSVARIPPLGFPLLRYGSRGDMVLWMQELLARETPAERTDGIFGPQTLANLRSFQAGHRIAATGQTGPLTWHALLRLPAVRVRWATADQHSPRRAHRTSEGETRSRIAPAPQSAALPAVAYEIHKPTGIDGAP